MGTIDTRYAEWKKKREAASQDEVSIDSKYKAWYAERNRDAISKAGEDIQTRLNTWLSNSNTYVDNYNSRYRDRTGTYADAYVTDSAQWLDTLTAQKSNFDAEAESIKSLMSRYGDYFDQTWMDSVTEALDSAGKAHAQILKVASEDKDYWTSFESEEAYKALQEEYRKQQIQAAAMEHPGGYDKARDWDAGEAGWAAYTADKQKQAEEESGRSLWETLLLNNATAFSYSDPSGSLVGQAFKNAQRVYAEDTSYKEPMEEWTDEQRNIFGYLYQMDAGQAQQYAAMVNDTINAQKRNAQMQQISEKAASSIGSGAANTVGSIVANIVFGLPEFADNLAEYSVRGRITQKGGVTPMDYASAAQSGVAQALNDWSGTVDENIFAIGGKGAGDLYGIGVSALQSLAATALTGSGTGVLASFMGMGGASAVDDALSRGASAEQAVLYGLINGAAEGLTEMIPADNLLKMDAAGWKKLLKGVMNQALGETVEEGVASVIEKVSDGIIMGENSVYKQTVQEYLSAGMSEEEAKKKAMLDMIGEVAFDAVGGFLSGSGNAAIVGGIQNLQQSVRPGQQSRETVKNAPEQAAVQQVQAGNVTPMQQAVQESTDTQNVVLTTGNAGVQAAQTTAGRINKPQATTGNSEQGTGQAAQAGAVESQTTAKATAAGKSADMTTKATSKEALPVGNELEVSGQEKTVLKETGKAVTIRKIASANDGVLTLELESGETVKAEDVAYSSEGEALIYEAVASLDVDAEIGNLLVGAYRENDGGVEAGDFALGMVDAFQYGMYNIPQRELAKNTFTAKLTTQQRNTAYLLGQRFGGKQIATAEAKARRARIAGLFEKARNAGADAGKSSDTGKVRFMDGKQTADLRSYIQKSGKKLSDIQETAVATMEKLSAVLGVDFYVYESYVKDGKRVYRDEHGTERPAPSGRYTHNGRIFVDLNAGNTGKGTMLYTVAHELTHFIRQWSPAKFKVLANFLMEQYGQKDISVEELVRKQMDKAKKNGLSISYDTAYEEVVADSMETMLNDGNVVLTMAELKQKDRTLWQKICDWFRKLAADLQAVVDAYKNHKPDSAEGRLVAQMQDVIVILESLYTDALVQASENYRAAGAEKNTAEGGVKYELREYSLQQKKNWETSKRIVVYENAEQLEKFVTDSANNKTMDKKLYFGAINTDLAKTILSKTGLDVEGYNLSLGSYEIRKILKDHGNESREALRGQRAVSADDFAHITDVILNPEKIVLSDDLYMGKPAIVFTGEHNGRMNVVAVVSDKRLDLFIQTVYVNTKKGNLATPTGDQAPINTPEASNGTVSSNNSIRNSEADVKEKFSLRDPAAEKAAEAVRKENEKLKEDVQRLRDLLKLQRQVTGGTKFTKSSVEAAARYLKQTAVARGDTADLAKLLNQFYEHIAQSKDLTWESVKEQAQPAAQWLMQHKAMEQDRTEYAEDILKDLRTSRISLDETQKDEAAYRYGSFNDFRKAAMGTVTVANDGVPLDVKWQEWASLYPNVFDANISATDMPGALMDTVESLRSADLSRVEAAYQADMIEQELLRQVYDSYWRVSTLRTVADRMQKQINALKSQHYTRMDKLRNEHREKTEQLKQEHREQVQRIRQEYRQKREQDQKKVAERNREARRLSVENRSKTAVRRKIRKAVLELRQLLEKGNKKRHVKDGMRDMALSALQAADILFTDEYTNRDMVRNGVGTEFSSDEERKLFREAQQLLGDIESMRFAETKEFASEIEARAYMDKLDGKLSSKMAKLKDVFARERKRLYGAKVSELLGNLAAEYRNLNNAADGAIRAAMDENVHSYLLQLQEEIRDVTVRDMNLVQLEAVADAYTMVLTTVHNANKMFDKNLKFRRDVLAAMAMEEIRKAGGSRKKEITAGREALEKFSWDNEKPVYAFERLGSATMQTLYGNIRKGQDVWAVDMQEADAFRREQYRKHKRKKWDLEKQYSFTSTAGDPFQLNLEQIMSLYAYSRREAAIDHLLKGGFVFSGNTDMVVQKNGIKRYVRQKDATAYNVSAEELNKILGTLSAEQRAFVEEMQAYLSDTMGGKGNEVSLQLYGIKQFEEKFYFPIRSAGQYMEKAKEDSFRKEQGQVSIVNSGFTKAVKPHANNPMILDGFMDVWAEHVNDMSMYHGFVLPMEDFRRVYNYSSPNMEGSASSSVNAVIENAFGKAATGYIDQLYKDLNGGAVTDNREGSGRKLVGLHKKAAVFASASVVIQQPSAFVRAFALVDPKYFIGPKVDQKQHKTLWEEVKKYAPVAFIKEMGYFDTGMGRSARDYLQAETYNGLHEKAAALVKDSTYRDELLGKAPALADEMTWCMIWEAVKRETKAKNPGMNTRSAAFLQKAGVRFSEVIDRTQVYDSVLSRSANMRSRTLHMNMLTSFMAEPTTSINMLEDALRKGLKGDKRYFARTLGAVYGSVLMNSVLVSLVYAMRDDDEDETFAEKYLSRLATEILDGINPVTYYPLVRDIWSIFRGYDVERADMTLISDLFSAVSSITTNMAKVEEAATEEQQETYLAKLKDALWGLADSVGSMTGVPVKNIRRDILAVFNAVETISEDLGGRKTTGLSLTDNVLEDVMKSIPIAGLLYSKGKGEKMLGAATAEDLAYFGRLRESYSSTNSYKTAFSNAVRESFSEGHLTQAEASELLKDYCGKTAAEATADVQYWAYRQHYPDTDVDDAWFDTFYEKVVKSGITIEVYVRYRSEVADITGKDKKVRRMAVIDSLPLTAAQKDALYYAEGWSESTIGETPWH